MKIFSLRDKILYGVIALCIVVIVAVFVTLKANKMEENPEEVKVEVVHKYLYEICIDSLTVSEGVVSSGQTLSTILEPYGVGMVKVNEITHAATGIFDFRDIRVDNNFVVLSTADSLSIPTHFIYEIGSIDYVVVELTNPVKVYKGAKPVEVRRSHKTVTIESSLWNAMIDAGASGALAMDLSDVFQWSVDFFGIQKGDGATIVYDENYVDDKFIGTGTIHGAIFNHGGKDYYGIRFSYKEGDKTISGYWDEEGKSLKSAFLKAPLKYSRISSKFSYSRLHPVLRIRRPHLGVDYAAPSGTPVFAIGDGVITNRAYMGGNGNYIKIKHARGYMSGYLHLKGFAKGISVGTHVEQGQLIGYVGSTGISTGPHLDFRIWLNGTAIDPLKLGQQKGKDIDQELRADYEKVKERMIAELRGEEYIEPIDSSTIVDSTFVDTTKVK